jgi:YegS/Rv2252/BmrU family lipid kinase
MIPADAKSVSVKELSSLFIINPASGKLSSRASRRERIENFIRRHSLDAKVEVTRSGGHAAQLSRAAVQAGDVDVVVSIGGDGTMNEVAGGLVGSNVAYAMIPTGSGNGLGRDLGLPMDPDRALEVLLDGRLRTIDTGSVNGLPFFNVMGLGFDAEIGRRFNLSHRRGLLTYLRIGLGVFVRYKKEPLEIDVGNGSPVHVDAFFTSIANSTQYGNNARIAPRALLDDGLLDLASITTRNPVSAAVLVTRLFAGSIDRSPSVRSFQSNHFKIKRAASGPIHTDGEVHDCGATLDIEVRPQSLRVVVPKG